MESPENEFIKRIDDLARRCERQSSICRTAFLTPAEVYQAEKHSVSKAYRYFVYGGSPDCERKILFLLPEWADEMSFSPDEYISAVHIHSYFGCPGHRDYLGALLGLGIERDSIGDIIILDSDAYVFCLPGVSSLIKDAEKIGRISVKACLCSLSEVPPPVRNTVAKTFSVMSPRLDAVIAEIFNISRSAALEKISSGLVSLNYSVCMKPDRPVSEQDIISVRGFGKACISGFGSLSKKGRRFITCQIYK